MYRFLFTPIGLIYFVSMAQTPLDEHNSMRYLALSQEFIYAARTGEPVDSFIEIFKNANLSILQQELYSDDLKKSFWINMYNGYTQALLKNDPGKYKNRNIFFTSTQIEIAHYPFSLDAIEHGILRRSKIKWSLGYLNKIFPRAIEKKLRVNTLDYRIHFALNCGAKSCPPIAFYNAENINKQLDLAMRVYLKAEVLYNRDMNILQLPAIMGWFRRDFGGKQKMLQLVKSLGIVPENEDPTISFLKYDWTLDI